jgi:hypothetical protein
MTPTRDVRITTRTTTPAAATPTRVDIVLGGERTPTPVRAPDILPKTGIYAADGGTSRREVIGGLMALAVAALAGTALIVRQRGMRAR